MSTLPLILLTLGQSGYANSAMSAVELALSVAKVQANDIVYDIGSGDGRVVILAAKKYKCRAVGIEFDKNFVNRSRLAVKQNKVQELVEIWHEDALKSDLSKATVIYLYHQTGFLDKLQLQLKELDPGTRVVCLDYPPKWMNLQPVATIPSAKSEDHHKHEIYLWQIQQ